MQTKVINQRQITSQLKILRVERKSIDFIPGQNIELGLPDGTLTREYSIYSPRNADYLEFLYRVIPQGNLSPWLSSLSTNDLLYLGKPTGFFTLGNEWENKKVLCISTGTGISPFHSIQLSNEHWNSTVLHGISYNSERIEYESFSKKPLACISREPPQEGYSGRVTQWLKEGDLSAYSHFMLCGNSDMIYQALVILEQRGIDRSKIKAEIYF